jgi:Ca2+-binding RTX toxin-like protein
MFPARARTSPTATPTPALTTFEGLEPRRLLAAGASLDANGILHVQGTDQADVITFEDATYRDGRPAVRAKVNDLTFVFGRKFVRGIRAAGGDGNDSIHVQSILDGSRAVIIFPDSAAPIRPGQGIDRFLRAILVATTLLGGGGHDTLVGGQAGDWLEGGEGDDQLAGQQGNDCVWGDAGNDSLYGGQGRDTLYGGDGDERLEGDGNRPIPGSNSRSFAQGRDVLYGGAGADTFDRFDGPREIKDRQDEDTHSRDVLIIPVRHTRS